MKLQGLTALVAVSAAGLAFSQGLPQGGYGLTPPKGISWPAGMTPPSDIDDLCFGSFFEALSSDAAVLGDGRAFLLYNVPFGAAFLEVTPSALDVVAIAGIVPEEPSEHHGLAMATDGGDLLYFEYDSLGGSTTSIATGSPWNGVSALRAADLDGLGKSDLIGATSTSLYQMHHDGVGWSSGPTISLLGALIDYVPVQWDLDAPLEIAAATTTGIYVYEASGTLVEAFASSATSGRLAALPAKDQQNTGALAWVFPGGASHALMRYGPGGSRSSCGTFNQPPAAIAAALFVQDGDRRADLIATTEVDQFARIWVEKSSSPKYAAGSPDASETVGSTAPFGDCRIAFDDISHDQVPDALIGRPGDEKVFYLPGSEISFAGADYPKLELTPFVDPEIVWDGSDSWFVTNLVLPANAETNYDYVQIRMWRSPDGDLLDSAQFRNVVFEFDDSMYDPEDPLTADMRIAIDLDESCGNALDDRGYYFGMRLVTLGSNGRPDSVSSEVDAGFTLVQGVATKMEVDSSGWLDLVVEDCPPGPSHAPCLIKKPLWALPNPSITPTVIDPPVQNPTIPALQ